MINFIQLTPDMVKDLNAGEHIYHANYTFVGMVRGYPAFVNGKYAVVLEYHGAVAILGESNAETGLYYVKERA